jgi:hypothetical protein
MRLRVQMQQSWEHRYSSYDNYATSGALMSGAFGWARAWLSEYSREALA